MKPTHFPQANVVLGAPRVPVPGAAEVLGLPVATDGTIFVSRWELTEAERVAIAAGAPVWLVVTGRAHPPVQLTVGPDADLEDAPS
ncbi:MAG TPA: hypothetical protein DCY40_03415 [Actinobacteria bacterium]|nr:hypothetical protein [Actinomycetota bacterium]